jgi:hypothetical protein
MNTNTNNQNSGSSKPQFASSKSKTQHAASIPQQVTAEELKSRLRSKEDVIRQLKYTKQLFLPESRFITIDFLRAVFSGEKKLLPIDEVRLVNLPILKAFSVNNLLRHVVAQNQHIRKHLPDFDLDQISGNQDGSGQTLDYKKCPVPRDFLIGVLNTLKPGFFASNFHQILEDGQKEKLRKEQESQKQIVITSEFYELLNSVSLLPMKRKC